MIPSRRHLRGRPPKPKGTVRAVVQNVSIGGERVGVRLDPSLAEKITNTAKREGCSVSGLMRACVEVLVECRCNAMLPHVREVLKR